MFTPLKCGNIQYDSCAEQAHRADDRIPCWTENLDESCRFKYRSNTQCNQKNRTNITNGFSNNLRLWRLISLLVKVIVILYGAMGHMPQNDCKKYNFQYNRNCPSSTSKEGRWFLYYTRPLQNIPINLLTAYHHSNPQKYLLPPQFSHRWLFAQKNPPPLLVDFSDCLRFYYLRCTFYVYIKPCFSVHVNISCLKIVYKFSVVFLYIINIWNCFLIYCVPFRKLVFFSYFICFFPFPAT